MQVININEDDILTFLRSIADSMDLQAGTFPITIVSIASGGTKLGEILRDVLSAKGVVDVNILSIRCQRPNAIQKKGNKRREKFSKYVFAMLPEFVLNRLRIFEHNRSLKSTHSTSSERNLTLLNDSTVLNKARTVIIIDDAIDSGRSFLKVADYVKNYKSSNKLFFNTFTVAISVTHPNPLVDPDFHWQKGNLVRFPWSLDAKNSRI